MPKDDPLGQTKTLWLDRDANEVARERYYKAFLATHTMVPDAYTRAHWDLAWAAAVAVHSFISEGRLGPAADDDGSD